jgi:hypothetical protein
MTARTGKAMTTRQIVASRKKQMAKQTSPENSLKHYYDNQNNLINQYREKLENNQLLKENEEFYDFNFNALVNTTLHRTKFLTQKFIKDSKSNDVFKTLIESIKKWYEDEISPYEQEHYHEDFDEDGQELYDVEGEEEAYEENVERVMHYRKHSLNHIAGMDSYVILRKLHCACKDIKDDFAFVGLCLIDVIEMLIYNTNFGTPASRKTFPKWKELTWTKYNKAI